MSTTATFDMDGMSGGESAPVRRYLNGIGLSHVQTLEDGMYHAYHQDEQGSTAYITEENRQVQNSYRYDAFGNLLEGKEDIENRILYTGQQYDQVTGQYYLRARYYNPAVGRFLQEDTYRGDGLNLYAYCANNPVMYYDPSGHDMDSSSCGNPSANDPGDPLAGQVSNEGGRKTGADRAAQYSDSWQSGRVEDAINRFASDATPTYTDSGKTIFRNETTGIKVVYDRNGIRY